VLLAQANIESWSTAHVSASSYNTAQREQIEEESYLCSFSFMYNHRHLCLRAENGFQDNFAYISGANSKGVKIPMTGETNGMGQGRSWRT
jgi:hypothetical protein